MFDIPSSLYSTSRLFSVSMSGSLVEKAASYPSSSQRAKNWNKVEAEIKKDEKEDMGDANAYVGFFLFHFPIRIQIDFFL
jgi:hypothetical protein